MYLCKRTNMQLQNRSKYMTIDNNQQIHFLQHKYTKCYNFAPYVGYGLMNTKKRRIECALLI